MKILVRTDPESSEYVYLVLGKEDIKEEVYHLIGKRKYLQAVAVAISLGKTLCIATEEKKQYLEADLILTEKSAHWDLTRRERS